MCLCSQRISEQYCRDKKNLKILFCKQKHYFCPEEAQKTKPVTNFFPHTVD